MTGICPTLVTPLNGNVEMSSNKLESVATYSCLTSYMLIGPQQRNCTADLGWSGEEPVCCKFVHLES